MFRFTVSAVLYNVSVVSSIVKGEVFFILVKPSSKLNTPYGEGVKDTEGRDLR